MLSNCRECKYGSDLGCSVNPRYWQAHAKLISLKNSHLSCVAPFMESCAEWEETQMLQGNPTPTFLQPESEADLVEATLQPQRPIQTELAGFCQFSLWQVPVFKFLDSKFDQAAIVAVIMVAPSLILWLAGVILNMELFVTLSVLLLPVEVSIAAFLMMKGLV